MGHLTVRQITQNDIRLWARHPLEKKGKIFLNIEQDLLDALDAEDPWPELFAIVGLRKGPPEQLVLPIVVGRHHATLNESDLEVELTILRYMPFCFWLTVWHKDSD